MCLGYVGGRHKGKMDEEHAGTLHFLCNSSTNLKIFHNGKFY